MVQTKKMNESLYAGFLKEINVAGELIRARQEEKQGLLDEFNAESKRFFFGKISERAFASSVKKTNNELLRLNSNIREAITKARNVARRVIGITTAQAPINFRATLSGITGGDVKKPARKKAVRRNPAKKKVSRKRPVKKRVVKKKKARRKPARKKR